uniref:Uncharacterized protein n=1 Tax=Tetradesmus obliquus TaxID=3088 RepID=A0A383V9D2_TETOB
MTLRSAYLAAMRSSVRVKVSLECCVHNSGAAAAAADKDDDDDDDDEARGDDMDMDEEGEEGRVFVDLVGELDDKDEPFYTPTE